MPKDKRDSNSIMISFRGSENLEDKIEKSRKKSGRSKGGEIRHLITQGLIKEALKK